MLTGRQRLRRGRVHNTIIICKERDAQNWINYAEEQGKIEKSTVRKFSMNPLPRYGNAFPSNINYIMMISFIYASNTIYIPFLRRLSISLKR